MDKIETLSLEVDGGILPDTRVFAARLLPAQARALLVQGDAPALVPAGLQQARRSARAARAAGADAVFITVLSESRIYRLSASARRERRRAGTRCDKRCKSKIKTTRCSRWGTRKRACSACWGAARLFGSLLDRSGALLLRAKPSRRIRARRRAAARPLRSAPAVDGGRPGFCFTVQGVRGAERKPPTGRRSPPPSPTRDEWLDALRAASWVASAGGAATAASQLIPRGGGRAARLAAEGVGGAPPVERPDTSSCAATASRTSLPGRPHAWRVPALRARRQRGCRRPTPPTRAPSRDDARRSAPTLAFAPTRRRRCATGSRRCATRDRRGRVGAAVTLGASAAAAAAAAAATPTKRGGGSIPTR